MSMSPMSKPESHTYLAHLMSEMLALPNLPDELRTAISEYLNKQLSLVNLLKPEYCLRLYPILAELAELTHGSEPRGHIIGKDNNLSERKAQDDNARRIEPSEVNITDVN